METFLVITKSKTLASNSLVQKYGRVFVIEEIKSNSPSGDPGICVHPRFSPEYGGIWLPEKQSHHYQYKICGRERR